MGWKIAFSYQDLLGIYLQMSFPTEAVSTHHEVSKRVPRSPSFCYRQSQGVWKPPREGDPRAGAAAPTRPRSSPYASLSWRATLVQPPRLREAGAGLRSGPPRKLQTEAPGADGQGRRRGAQHSGGEAAKPFKDPDYFPLNEKQQQQQLLPSRAPAPP